MDEKGNKEKKKKIARSLLSNGFYYVYVVYSEKRFTLYGSWKAARENKIDVISVDEKTTSYEELLLSYFDCCLSEYISSIIHGSSENDNSSSNRFYNELLNIKKTLKVCKTKTLRASSRNDYLVTWKSNNNTIFTPIEIDDDGNQSELIVIEDVSQYLSMVHTHFASCKTYYRGQKLGQLNYPSLFREEEYVKREKKMIEELYSVLPYEMSKFEYEIEKLITLKHYNLPSRFYDITLNPLVGLYFACDDGVYAEPNSQNGVVMTCFANEKIQEKGLFSDTVTTLATLSYIDRKKDNESKEFIREFEYQAKRMDKRFYDGVVEDMSAFDMVLLFNPVLSIQRIINQHGAFLLTGRNNSNIYEPPFDFFSAFVRKVNGKLMRKVFIVPYDRKAQILEELDNLGISTDTMYPDLDHTIAYRKKQIDLMIKGKKNGSSKEEKA